MVRLRRPINTWRNEAVPSRNDKVMTEDTVRSEKSGRVNSHRNNIQGRFFGSELRFSTFQRMHGDAFLRSANKTIE